MSTARFVGRTAESFTKYYGVKPTDVDEKPHERKDALGATRSLYITMHPDQHADDVHFSLERTRQVRMSDLPVEQHLYKGQGLKGFQVLGEKHAATVSQFLQCSTPEQIQLKAAKFIENSLD